MDRKVTEFLIDTLQYVNEQNVLVEDLRAIIKNSEEDMDRMVEQEMELRAKLKRLKEGG